MRLPEEGVVIPRTVAMANAGRDRHDGMLDGASVGTAELDVDGFCAVRSATPSIAADATITGLVHLDAGAVLVLQANGC